MVKCHMRDFMSITKALADPNRVRLLLALEGRELCVCQLTALLELAPSTVSKHLSILHQARLVEMRKDGRWNYYRQADAGAAPVLGEALAWVRRSLSGEEQIARDALRIAELAAMNAEDLCAVLGCTIKVLFLCTGNSCRSQMAEGWVRALKAGSIQPYSAGTRDGALDPRAVQVMAEAGVDISAQRSKSLEMLRDAVNRELPQFDYVVTVCAAAHEACPTFPGRTHMVHAGFDDPPALALAAQSEAEALGHYRRVRDEIKAYVERLPQALLQGDITPAQKACQR
jgi:arsenate reductase (thioredoxin)